MTRYAVYGVPGDGQAPEVARRLRCRAEAWYADNPAITLDPRRYGFHATLKAPFRLAEGVGADELQRSVGAFAAAREAVMLPSIRPAAIGRFRALVPGAPADALDALAADAVRELDGMRAPLTEAEYVRRRPERLSQRQRALLEAWGYPYVLDEFRCHLTLTDPIPDEDADAVDQAIAEHFADIAGADVPLVALTVCVEPEPGAPFRPFSVHPLGTPAGRGDGPATRGEATTFPLTTDRESFR